MAPPPVVTGISPKDGPPGTRVTIRGEYLGKDSNDFIGLNICGCDCFLSAEWKSSNKIIARSGPGKGRGDIIISTRSGGKGSCTVQFRGYHETVGPLKESAVWIEETPLPSLSWGHRSLSHSTYHLEDPLGLSVEDNEKKFPEDDLHELFPDCSGDLAQENFEPNWFLLEYHHATSFDDLKAGLTYLKRKVDGQKEGQLSFLKDNVSSVMEQMDTLFLLKEKFEDDMSKYEGNPTLKAENVIVDSLVESKKLFEDVLTRRERADATRNALAVMTRYKFLFFLPMNIEHNIKHDDFDLVMSDLARARNLFGKFETAVFKQILCEVIKTIENVKKSLHDELRAMSPHLEKQKKVIRNLVVLGTDSDPGWEAICITYQLIETQLITFRERHMNLEPAFIDMEMGKTRDGVNGVTDSLSNRNLLKNIQNNSPPRIMFIEAVTESIIQTLPEMWKLGQAYFNGELLIKPDRSKQNEFTHLIYRLTQLACNLLRGALLTYNSESKEFQWTLHSAAEQAHVTDMLSFWFPHCIRLIQAMYLSLISIEFSKGTVELLVKLLLDLRTHSMIILLKKTSDQVKSLSSKENWQLDFSPNYGAITQMPSEFEKLVTESVHRVKESALDTERKELCILTSTAAKQELTSLVNKIFSNFVQVLEFLGMISEEHDCAGTVSQLIGSPVSYNIKGTSSGMTAEQRLLLMMSNCRYTWNVIFPKLSILFRHNGFPPIGNAIQQCRNVLENLENRMSETYVEMKSEPLVGTIEPSMYLGHFEWNTCSKPTDILPYAKEILTNVTAVYAEVHRLVPKLLYKIISQIVETVAEELCRLMSCVVKFNEHGKLQATIDIITLERTLKKFTNDNATSFFHEALQATGILSELENRFA